MTRYEKLFRKLKENPQSLSFHDYEKILLHFGFELDEARGSHKKYEKDGIIVVLSPHQNEIPYYQKKFTQKTLLKYFIR